MVEKIDERDLKNKVAKLAVLDALAQEISAGWTSEKSGIEMLEEMREERYQLLAQRHNSCHKS